MEPQVSILGFLFFRQDLSVSSSHRAEMFREAILQNVFIRRPGFVKSAQFDPNAVCGADSAHRPEACKNIARGKGKFG